MRVPLSMSELDLAKLIGVTPEHLSRLLARMSKHDIIRKDKGWILICDPGRVPALGAPGSLRQVGQLTVF
jgi:CRP-like cAMP-binding protein